MWATGAASSILFYEEYIVIDPGHTELKRMQILTEEEFLEARERYGMSFTRAWARRPSAPFWSAWTSTLSRKSCAGK